MNNLPDSWVKARIKNVCTHPQYGWTTKAVNQGKYKLLRTTDITSGNVDWDQVPFCLEAPSDPQKFYLHRGDILVSRAGSVGKSFIIKQDADNTVYASYLVRFKPHIVSEYVHYFMQSGFYWKQIQEQSAGIALLNVNASKLADINLPIPPLNEQHRIVSKIEELFSDLDAGQAALRKAQRLIEMYRQSVLKAAVTGELTRDWREKSSSRPIDSLLAEVKQLRKKLWKGKYKESPKPKTDNLPELPQSWTWLSLGELSYFITSGSRGWAEYYADKGSYFLRSQNIGKQGFKLNDIAYVIPPKSAEGLRTKLQLDDLVLSITGEPGNVARTTEREANGYISQHVALIRLCKPNMAKYIELCIRSKIGEKYFEKVRYGATKPGLNLTQVAECPIAIPSLAEQEEIVRLTNSLMSAIDNIEMSINEQAARFSSLRQSILKQAFEGKLVPQDPADEPASELLKRISIQYSQPKAARGRKKKATA